MAVATAFTLPSASADLVTVNVTLANGTTVPVQVNVPPGTPLENIHIPPVTTPTVPVPAPTPSTPTPVTGGGGGNSGSGNSGSGDGGSPGSGSTGKFGQLIASARQRHAQLPVRSDPHHHARR